MPARAARKRMSPAGHRRRPIRSIDIEFNGRLARIHCGTISKYLPNLWRRAWEDIYCGYLSLDKYCDLNCRNPVVWKALGLLGRYLQEIDGSVTVSAAISNGLEEIWRASPFWGGNGQHSTADVFVSLATMFDPKYFGCNVKIFKEMESFFLRHSSEILQGMSRHPRAYITGLDRMSYNKPTVMNMTPSLASLLQESDADPDDLLSPRGVFKLSRKSRRILSTLRKQSDRSSRSCELAPRLNPHLGIAHNRSPPLHRQGPCCRDLQRYQAAPVRGDKMHPLELQNYCLHAPHQVTIHGPRPDFDDRDLYGDDFSDEESESSDDDFSLYDADHLLEGDHRCHHDLDNIFQSPHYRYGHIPKSHGHIPMQALLHHMY